MYTIKQPKTIIFGKNCASKYEFPKNSLVITSKGAKKRGWLDYLSLTDYYVFDEVESNPSIEITQKIFSEFKNFKFSCVIGLGGGSSLDVAKYCASLMEKQKIMIPTTFGSGSEVTRIAVLKVNGEKKSFHNDNLFSDIAIVDSHFIHNTPKEIIYNSGIDACAQCTEAYDSKTANNYTKFLCNKAFDLLETGLLKNEYEQLVLGSLISGLGFGNSSTTLGHALSYVYSNEGISHGHALAFTTTVAHRFNQSKFYERFLNIVTKLNFSKINLTANLDDASELILIDSKHLDNNPMQITKKDISYLLNIINTERAFEKFSLE